MSEVDTCWNCGTSEKELVIDVAELKAKLAKVERRHTPIYHSVRCPDGISGCAVGHFSSNSMCRVCLLPFPCPTIRDIGWTDPQLTGTQISAIKTINAFTTDQIRKSKVTMENPF